MGGWIGLPFEARFWLLFLAIGGTGYAVAWLLRRPLGRFRTNVVLLLVANALGVWVACRIAAMLLDKSFYAGGFLGWTIQVLMLTGFLIDLAARLLRADERRWLVPAVIAALVLGGAAIGRASADRESGDLAVANLVMSDHLSARFWRDPDWNRIRLAMLARMPDKFDAAILPYRDALVTALRNRDRAAIARIDGRISSALIEVAERPSEDLARASDAAILRYGRAHQAWLAAVAGDPETCAILAGIRKSRPERPLRIDDAIGPSMSERQVAMIDLIADARATPRRPPRALPTMDEWAEMHVRMDRRLPPALAGNPSSPEKMAALDAKSQCDIARNWLDILLSQPRSAYVRAFVMAADNQPGRFPR